MKKSSIVSLAGFAATMLISSTAFAWLEKTGERDEALHLKPDHENGIEVFEVCAACHLTEGWGTKDGTFLFKDNCVKCHGENGEGKAEKFYPKIQGQHYKYMLRQFEWIRDGKRRNANPDMVKQIKNFSNEDMKQVINYVSRIPVPKEDLAPSKDWTNPDYD